MKKKTPKNVTWGQLVLSYEIKLNELDKLEKIALLNY